MPKLDVSKLEPGMVLARPVTNKSGMVMLGEGTELTVDLIDKVRDMGVEGVYVQGMSQPEIPLEDELAALDARFAYVDREPLMATIKRLMKEHIEGLYG